MHDLKKAIESELFKCYINVILATKGQIKSGSRLKPSTKRGDKFIDQGFNWQLGGAINAHGTHLSPRLTKGSNPSLTAIVRKEN